MSQAVIDRGAALGGSGCGQRGLHADPAALAQAKAASAYCPVLRRARDEAGYHNHDAEFRENGRQIDSLLRDTDSGLRLVVDLGGVARGWRERGGVFHRHSGRTDGIRLRNARQKVPLGQVRELMAAAGDGDDQGELGCCWVLAEEE